MYVLKRTPESSRNESEESTSCEAGTSWWSGARLLLALALCLAALALQLKAQAAIGAAAQGSSHATALPLSGRSAQNGAVSSLFSFDLARVNLARATGDAEAELPNLVKGTRP